MYKQVQSRIDVLHDMVIPATIGVGCAFLEQSTTDIPTRLAIGMQLGVELARMGNIRSNNNHATLCCLSILVSFITTSKLIHSSSNT